MDRFDRDAAFIGSIPDVYDRLLVPLIFAPYAVDLARRVAHCNPGRVLELAAGTGVVTRQLAQTLPPEVDIVATDLNPAMLARAASVGTARPVDWRPADALALPFADATFDLVVCQFGVMFFPDKAQAFAEARRVLHPDGHFLFNVWDRLDDNDFAAVVTDALERRFPDDPPRFLARVPHGYHDPAVIAQDLARGGFTRSPEVLTLAARRQADAPRVPALAYCQGTPLRREIEALGPGSLAEATETATAAIAEQFGAGRIDGKIQAHVVTIARER